MDTAVPMNVIVDNLVELTDHMTDVATGEALAPILFGIGVLLIVFSIGVFGFLTLGAIGSIVSLE